MFAQQARSQSNRKLNRSRSSRPLVERMEPRTLLSAVTWTGGAGDNNWDTPGNWSTDSVPGSADDVTINIAANVVHSNDVTDSINSLTSKEPLTLSGGTLSIAAASTIDSTLAITGGTLAGAGNLTVSGLVTFTGGTISGSSVLNANGGMLIADNSTGSSTSFVDGRTINNPADQTVTWTGSNDIRLGDGAVFNNLGSFLAQNGGDFAVGDGAAPSFVNKGSFTSSSGFVLDVPFDVPGGSVDVQTGSLVLEDGGSSTGAAFNIETQGTLEFWAPYTFDTSTTISGDGELHHIDYSFTQVLPGNYSFAGTTLLDAGGLQVDGSLAGSTVVMNTGDSGNLSGTGTVGPITDDLGGISPGDGTGPGILNANGSVFLGAKDDSGGGLIVALNGPNPGTGYSQLIASGQVDLDPDGSFLDASLGFTPTSGEQFTIIKSTVPVVGQFNGLPEGSSLTIGNTNFTISYHGGDGNDVVLTEASTIAAPTVSGVNPNSGPAAGGTLVTITGTGFTGATAVEFGTNLSTDWTVVNDTTITADSPAGSGTADVTVVTPGGTSATSAADRFTYTAALAAPAVTGITPASGPAAGGTLVTITGSAFTGATAVDFGTTPATNVKVVNSTTITANSPAGSGTADVTVVTPGGRSASLAADRFTYTVAAAAPAVTGINPSSGPAAGGTLVTITGTGFAGVTAVDFGTTAATDVVVVNGTTITAISPAGSGAVDVTVVTPSGTSATSAADRFAYTAAVTAPAVVSVERFGFHMHPTYLVLAFNGPLDPVRAEDVSNYQIVAMSGGERDGVVAGHVTRSPCRCLQPGELDRDAVPAPAAEYPQLLSSHCRRRDAERVEKRHGHSARQSWQRRPGQQLPNDLELE